MSAKRVKVNQRQVEQRAKKDRLKRLPYIVPSKNTVEFVAPAETHFNRMMGHNVPLQKVTLEGVLSTDGRLGSVRYYYIPKGVHQNLTSLIQQFHLPATIHNDLIWVFLNMFFAATEAVYSTNFYKNFDKQCQQQVEILEFFEQLADGSNEIVDTKISYRKKGAPPKTTKVLNLESEIVLPVLLAGIPAFQATEFYKAMKPFLDVYRQEPKHDLFFGHKNAEKHWQSYYAGVIYEYLQNTVFAGLSSVPKEQLEQETKRLKKLFSQRKRFLFIGKLMELAGLLSSMEAKDDAGIIEVIKKKLASRLKSESESHKEFERRFGEK